MMELIASAATLDEAYAWLCHRRRNAPSNHGVWHFRWRWAEVKPQLQQEPLAGELRLGAVTVVPTADGLIEAWSPRDALVLKAVALVLSRRLAPGVPSSCHCFSGNGGVKAAVRALAAAIGENAFVFPRRGTNEALRSDVKSYYASLDAEVVYDLLARYVEEPRVLGLFPRRGTNGKQWRYLHRTVCDGGGDYRDVGRGIPRGCPLSWLLGALCLVDVDRRMAEMGLFYARFMDDWVVLAPTWWRLRKAVRAVREVVAELKLELAPDKTFVGWISRGFDFLGYRFGPEGVGVARRTVERFAERVNRLYEQGGVSHIVGAAGQAARDKFERDLRRWAGMSTVYATSRGPAARTPISQRSSRPSRCIAVADGDCRELDAGQAAAFALLPRGVLTPLSECGLRVSVADRLRARIELPAQLHRGLAASHKFYHLSPEFLRVLVVDTPPS